MPIIRKSTDASAPVLTGMPGALSALLRACLVEGYPGGAAPGGWEIPHADGDVICLRSTHPLATGLYWRIDDTGVVAPALGRVARIRGYRAMTGAHAGTYPWPTEAQEGAAGMRFPKSETADTTARSWVLIADERTVYLFVSQGPSYSGVFSPLFFGDFKSFKEPDAYGALLFAQRAGVIDPAYNAATVQFSGRSNGSYYCRYVAASAIGAVTPLAITHATPAFGSSASPGLGVLPVPCETDGRLWVAPMLLQESVTRPRGTLRGLFESLHSASPWSWLQNVPDLDGLPTECVALPLWSGEGGVHVCLVADLSGDTW